jgi:hypothetical protein
MMNALFGRVGMKQEYTETRVLGDDSKEWKEIREIHHMYGLGDNKSLVCYTPEGDREVTFDSNCALSAAVTAYSHVHLWNYMKQVGFRVWMTDTDSIVTDTPLPPECLGDSLGMMELEKEFSQALFVLATPGYAWLRQA